ncbi:PIG-L family deacetylase [Dinoroseobacter sp. S124A]|uniref:PIG-L family deacetylase n=1 Tax=Dinoroseobacter sp. S124A TaxID=3415128 RepID=UPI003C7C432D
MPTPDQTRIAAQRAAPRITALWRALRPLQTTVSFMNSGAHPDDEISDMLAALSWRDGIELSYVCANRGEGGQNDIGTEATTALGTLRTAEMERAAEILPLRLYWLSEHPDDAIFDFGFSKSGEETLRNWGRDRTLTRLVQVIRAEKPDILCPTFLDVPGQHGHHRAMTQAAHEAFDLAADPGFAPELGAPWEIAKLYLPAWSGAGQAYDDNLPPPPATMTVPAAGRDPVTGWDYAQIGQQSRACHRTQAMGRWVPRGAGRDLPLHLARRRTTGPDTAVSDGLPAALSALDSPAKADLAEAEAQIARAAAAFPDTAGILAAATAALQALRQAAEARNPPRSAHRIARKIAQLSTLIRAAAGVEIHGHVARTVLAPGEVTELTVEHFAETGSVEVMPMLPPDWVQGGSAIGPGPEAAPSDAYPPVFLPDAPSTPALRVVTRALGVESVTSLPFETPPLVQPARSLSCDQTRIAVNRAAPPEVIELILREIRPSGATPGITLPEGWRAEPTATGLRVTLPKDPAEGLYRLPLTLDGAPAHESQLIVHDHTAPRLLSGAAEVQVRVLDAALHPGRIGYIGGGNDRVDHWLGQIGADVTALSDRELSDAEALARYDTLVIGIFAIRMRKGLTEALPAIHDWVAQGGTLLTLYHRPWDNWDAARTAPRPLEIGQPSLRWRVTDERAEVTALAPDHPCLTHPNRIGPKDWEGWHKERGLYFAKSWDAAYTPLLEMADPGEAPHRGALLAAEIGAGRHVHCALILHHQMERLTPGAFRLVMNLTAPRAG